jgi:hypothetical protein
VGDVVFVVGFFVGTHLPSRGGCPLLHTQVPGLAPGTWLWPGGQDFGGGACGAQVPLGLGTRPLGQGCTQFSPRFTKGGGHACGATRAGVPTGAIGAGPAGVPTGAGMQPPLGLRTSPGGQPPVGGVGIGPHLPSRSCTWPGGQTIEQAAPSAVDPGGQHWNVDVSCPGGHGRSCGGHWWPLARSPPGHWHWPVGPSLAPAGHWHAPP